MTQKKPLISRGAMRHAQRNAQNTDFMLVVALAIIQAQRPRDLQQQMEQPSVEVNVDKWFGQGNREFLGFILSHRGMKLPDVQEGLQRFFEGHRRIFLRLKKMDPNELHATIYAVIVAQRGVQQQTA